MSEYWKSTPKYWCKHCKTFVRDTKFERQNHEATGRHQGNLQRFLRELHRGHEREERGNQRAKDEVARLNGIAKPTSKPLDDPAATRGTAIAASRPDSRDVNPAERKRQLTQLAEMGVAVPEDFRREMAMAGDWQTLSVTPIPQGVRKEEEEEDKKHDLKLSATVSEGRKRKKDEDEDEVEGLVTRKGWRSTTRTYPDEEARSGQVLDALLQSTQIRRPESKNTDLACVVGDRTGPGQAEESKSSSSLGIKTEHIEENKADVLDAINNDATSENMAGIVFKKRKAKSIRQPGS